MTMNFETLKEDCAKYAESNPITICGDYRDELPADMIEALLDGNLDKFSELQWECELNMQEYETYSERESFDQWIKDNGLELSEDQESELWEIWSENQFRNYSDFWNTCFGNSRPHIVAIPEKRNGENIEFPNMDFDKRTNSRLNDYLRKVHGWDGWKAETLYPYDILKVIGTIDLKELYENLCKGLKPWGIRLDQGYVITHNNFNGSGGLGNIGPSKSKAPYKACFRFDNNDKYGVQAVFGFTESAWRDELNVVYR